LGVGCGALAAREHSSAFDSGIRAVASVGQAVPAFWLASLVLLLPAQLWHYAPPLGKAAGLFSDPFANMRQFLPASLVLALGPAAFLMRLTRSSVLEVLQEDYVRTARSKGLLESVVLREHVLKNAFAPVLTVLGLLVAELLGG